MANKWTTPVLEELDIPTGTYGSVDDPNGNQDFGGAPADASLTAS